MSHARSVAVSAAAAGLLLAGCGGSGSGTKVAGVTVQDHGTKDANAGGTIHMQAGNYYFAPTVLTGKPGDKVTISLSNRSGVPHNFSIDAQHINTDIESGHVVTLNVTFPQSGVVSFYCAFHKVRGMAGGLKVR